MNRVFFIVGPTAAGKSELAAEIAAECGAEIVSADAFQIYRGLDLLTAKPGGETLAKVRHHLIGKTSLEEEFNAGKFRTLAQAALDDIHAREKPAIVVGGSGLYIKSLTHGLARLPGADRQLREQLSNLSVDELHARLSQLDPVIANKIDRKNPRRLIRALEVCLGMGEPFSRQRKEWLRPEKVDVPGSGIEKPHEHSIPDMASVPKMDGVFVFRHRAELHERINRRVESMFRNGVVEEVRRAGEAGPTAKQALGLREVRQVIAGEISELQAIASIQQATRRYAKRQLTWFGSQTNFSPLNLSLQSPSESIEWILREARLSFAHTHD